MTNAELLSFLLESPDTEVEEILLRWFLQSRRFQSFMVEYKTKVRKKLRLATTPESLQSLLLELDIACHLLQDKRFSVEYEKYGQGRERNPDLTVTFRTNTSFNLEATRVKMVQEEPEVRAEKLIRIVCGKLGQLVPQMLNCLVIATEGNYLTDGEVTTAMKSLRQRVELRDVDLLSRIGFTDPAAFYKQYQWLNGIIFSVSSELEEGAKTLIWTNSQAKSPLLPEIHVVLQTLPVISCYFPEG